MTFASEWSGFNRVNLIDADLFFDFLCHARKRIIKRETRMNNVVTRTTKFMKTGFAGGGT